MGGLLLSWGCTGTSQIQRPGSDRAAARPLAPEPSPVAPAVALDDGKSHIVRTGVWEDTTAAVKRGADKVSQSLNPQKPALPPDDPTALATKSNPRPELYIAAAQVHEQSGRVAQAEESYQQAFRLAPNHLPTQLAYARFKDRQQQGQEALDIYHRASKDHPNDATVFNDLGMYYARRNQNREAIAAFERAVQLQPQRAIYRNNLALVLVQENRAGEALVNLSAVYNEADACYKVGYLVQKRGDSALAMQYFGRALQVNPALTDARAWYNHLQAGQAAPAAAPQLAEPTPRPTTAPPLVASVPRPDPVAPSPEPTPPPVAPPVPMQPQARSLEPEPATAPIAPPKPRQLPPVPKRLPTPEPNRPAPTPLPPVTPRAENAPSPPDAPLPPG